MPSNLFGHEGAQKAALHHYTKTFRSFSAMLTPDQAAKLAEKLICYRLESIYRKIVGARFYTAGFEAENGPLESFGYTFFRSARDRDGHGTHTAATIAGSPVDNVSLFGVGRGTASGGVVRARLTIYNAFWFNLRRYYIHVCWTGSAPTYLL
ncbi:subtilisin-like protease [Olea europaea subsp. europaea]|uniref:Subtilisin-like protease n=1 Tax=Olea europaea subsp. europaea TaxID=158383 RepID=A0A8S0VHG0_OLEEU|nr:subtilisin-like protease [Olea europaea subsp. europaea]